MTWTVFESPLGPLTLIGSAAGLRNVHFPGRSPGLAESERDTAALADAAAQLDDYFAGQRQSFELALDLAGTTFQRQVWDALQSLPYGQTTTYGELAGELGVRPTGSFSAAARKVASAIAATPAPIVLPCHRVIGADGSLTGYRGGLARKGALLRFEATGRIIDARWESRQHEQLALL
jgi:methylated-DNA-[protein]-cysteine S-methyltransferase